MKLKVYFYNELIGFTHFFIESPLIEYLHIIRFMLVASIGVFEG